MRKFHKSSTERRTNRIKGNAEVCSELCKKLIVNYLEGALHLSQSRSNDLLNLVEIWWFQVLWNLNRRDLDPRLVDPCGSLVL